MIVQHNLTAMNSNRMLGLTTKTQAKSTEKLSSGYKINRAADDAAGLSISEKMRKQIRGLTQASANAQDGISAVQTAEGALTEVHDMLQRMNELAVKAANGTNSVDDREYIQNEIDQLVTEIDRVAETTKFNETYLLKGDAKNTQNTIKYSTTETPASFEAKNGADGNPIKFYAKDGTAELTEDEAIEELKNNRPLYTSAATAQTEDTSVSYTAATPASIVKNSDVYDSTNGYAAVDPTTLVEMKADGTGVQLKGGIVATNYSSQNGPGGLFTDDTGITGSVTFTAAVPESYTGTFTGLYAAGGTTVLTEDEAKAAVKAGEKVYSDAATPQTEAKSSDYSYTPAGKPALYDANGNKISENGLDGYIKIKEDGTYEMKDGKELYKDENGKVAFDPTADAATYLVTDTKIAALDLDLHVGADATENNQISMKIESMSADGLGVKGLKVDGKTDENARNAIETIKAAIQRVSTQRSALGAIQNRLEHTINNLDNVVENTTSAEAQIRDTNMATEMVKYSNNNILAQAGQAMLAQANQANQGVLSLLG